MARIVPALAAAAILLLWSLSPPARLLPGKVPILRIPDAAPAMTASPSPVILPAPFDYLSILASLTSSREGLSEHVGDWCRLEAALIAREPHVLEELLRRYVAEIEPAYKGLLAVLLSTEIENHHRIHIDQQELPKEGWDLFHGMALLALARKRPESPEAALAPERVAWWKRLFRFIDVGVIDHAGAVENRVTGQYRKRLACSTSMQHMSSMYEIARECSPVSDSGVRAALLDAFTAEWDWDFPRVLSRIVLRKSASADTVLARTLAYTYLASASEEAADQGLDLLRWTVLPDDSFPLLEKWARAATSDSVLRDAIHLLGAQKSAAAERVLTDLYAMTSGRPEIREKVLYCMADHAGSSFQPIAAAELRSEDRDIRVASLRILACMPTEEALNLILQTAVTDPQPKVRYEALSVLQDRNVWSLREEQILTALKSDSHAWVRKFATSLLEAEDRTQVSDSRLGSSWDWTDPGEEP